MLSFTLRTLRLTRTQKPITKLSDTERSGLLSLYDYAHFFGTLIKSEFERQFLLYTHLGDLAKGRRAY